MQNSPITATAPHPEGEASADWADEALALAQRVTSKIRQPTPIAPQPVVDDEYEPQAVVEKKPAKRPTTR